MISQTKSLALTGLLIGGAVVAAWLIDPDRHHPSDMKTAAAASARDSAYLPLQDTTADTDAISLERPLDPRFASTLQAARDSLDRHDRASAKVLVDAILMLDRSNPQALALQRELQSHDAAPADNNKAVAVVTDAQPAAQISVKAAKKTAAAPHRHRPKTPRADPATTPDDTMPIRDSPPILGETVETPATAAAEQISTGAERTSEHMKPAHTGSQGSDGATGEPAHSGDNQ
ncbi:hypothetical protein [Paraburkholderia diazotrophica]|uniref:Uncharacterized protein n=1 Tax=Paraburkholderia diazotrophica TaxID=667676 RepID=A0A1H7EMW3_9BURK|nr:hypothetical protein [Paraburkholderia diazotrophica]SEK13362.1 hypothetical protein SAMN05192539_10676 [Paraburkholderia diazotrophica]